MIPKNAIEELVEFRFTLQRDYLVSISIFQLVCECFQKTLLVVEIVLVQVDEHCFQRFRSQTVMSMLINTKGFVDTRITIDKERSQGFTQSLFEFLRRQQCSKILRVYNN